ncbi:MAG: mandelate racemase/muconate lactonizing enzyme family protein [Terriglobia bacterium]
MTKTNICVVRAVPLERALDKVFHGSTYAIRSRYTLVTEVLLDNGVSGQTFGGDEELYQKQIASLINGPFQNLLVGKDVFDIESAWETMFNAVSPDLVNRGIHTLDLANKAILMQAIAAVDIALWDAIGKTVNLPLYKLLGGHRDKLPVIAIGGYYTDGKTDKDLAEELLSYKRSGLAGVKFKVGGLPPSEDAERVRYARQVVGADFILACDANQAWTVEQALEFCRRVRNFNIRWIEEPVQWYDQMHGLARVREQGGIPVVAGQGEISRFGCRDLVTSGGVDILNFDATIGGGITEWRRVAGMASMFNISMAHHEEPQVAVHLLASIPHGLYVEIFPDPTRDPMWNELPRFHPKIENGFMYAPQQPGLGLPLKAETIDRYRVQAG